MLANDRPLRRPECWASLRSTSPVNMLAVKSLLPDKGSMRALQLPLPAQRPLPLPLPLQLLVKLPLPLPLPLP